MPRRNIKVTEEDQELRDDFLPLDVGKRPRGIRNFFTNNIFKRSLAHLIGKGPRKSELLRTNGWGNLLVCNQGSWAPSIDVEAQTLSDDNWHEYIFNLAVFKVDLWIYNYDANVKVYTNDRPLGAQFTIKAESFYAIECPIWKIELQNAVGGNNIGFQAIAYGENTSRLKAQGYKTEKTDWPST